MSDSLLLPAPQADTSPERVQMSIRLRFNPLRNLTPALLAQYLDSWRLGFFRNIALTWDAMERRDTRLQTVAPKRKKSVARLGWEILTIDDSPAALKQKTALEFFYNHLIASTALEPDERGGMSLLVRQMMDAVGKRYAVHEITWQPGPHGLTAQFTFCPLWWFEGVTGKLRYPRISINWGDIGDEASTGEAKFRAASFCDSSGAAKTAYVLMTQPI